MCSNPRQLLKTKDFLDYYSVLKTAQALGLQIAGLRKMSVFNKSLSFLISNNTDFAELPVSYFRNLELSLYIYLLPPECVEKEMQLMQVTSPAVFMS